MQLAPFMDYPRAAMILQSYNRLHQRCVRWVPECVRGGVEKGRGDGERD